jgi:hypothetical protein
VHPVAAVLGICDEREQQAILEARTVGRDPEQR